MNTITKSQRDEIMRREETLRAFLGKRSSYRPEEVGHLNPPTTDERSLVDIFDFMAEKPGQYFAYRPGIGPVTNWMGFKLADVVSVGREWRDNFGGKRYSFRCRAINGVEYSGTAFPSAGDYVRLRAVKR